LGPFGVVLALIFSLFIAVLAIANNQPVVINYLLGKAEVSAVVVILGAAVLGALIIFILGLLGSIKGRLRFRNMRHELKSLQEKVQSLQAERDILLAQVGRLEETMANTVREAKEPDDKEGIAANSAVYRAVEEKKEENSAD